MEANARSFIFLGMEGAVKIPFFQRTYVWDQENWDDLLTDLFNTEKGHFLGSLILKQQKRPTGEPKELLVIDGQQRLTTLSVLLKALYDSFPETLKKNCQEKIRTYLFYKKDETASEYFVKIQHSHVDSEAYDTVLRTGIDGRSMELSPTATKNKIINCYQYFLSDLQKRTEQERRDLFNRIVNHDNKMLVVIDLNEEDDEQTIFDTINSAGVRLSPADTIKNALFQKAIDLYKDNRKAINLYRTTWESAFLADEETIEYWNRERLTGRLRRDNIEILLHCIAVIQGFYDPDVHTLDQLSSQYKKELVKFDSEEKLTKFINEIKDYAKTYREQIPAFDNSTFLSYEDSSQRLFHILDSLQISTLHPFILHLLKNNMGERDRNRILHDLERFVVRRMISRQETKSYNKLCKEFIRSPDIVGAKAEEATNDQIADGLKNITNSNASLLLFWVELFRRYNDKKFGVRELKYNFSLEHVMPQKWEEHWHDIPQKKNQDGTLMTSEELKKDRYSKVYWIGNMTLLTSSLNSALRNYGFEKKVNGDGRKKGMKAYAELSITKEIISPDDERGNVCWNEDKIIKRTNFLSSEIDQIWGNSRKSN